MQIDERLTAFVYNFTIGIGDMVIEGNDGILATCVFMC
jgi:hypothetical protein